MTKEELQKLKDEYEKKFVNLITELDNKIDELKKSEQQTNRRWYPEYKEPYFSILDNGTILNLKWSNGPIDQMRYSIDNVFKTREEAEFAVERLKVLAELKSFADDEQEWDGKNDHWYIEYIENKGHVDVAYFFNTRDIPYDLFFSSREQALEAIWAIGEERLKKYYFCVKE